MTQSTGPANYLGTVGMIGMSVALDVGSATAPIRINATSDMVTNPQFDDSLPSGLVLNSSSAEFSDAVANPNVAVLAPGATNRIYLGSVTFQSLTNGSQNIVAISGPSLNVDGAFNEMVVSSGILGVTVVPEPSTILLLAAGGLGLCRVIVRRRKEVATPVLAA